MSSVLQVENINVYYGSIHAVKDVSFHVEQGEVVTLIGANGAGKSTTLNTVAGLLRSRTGSVRFMDEELRHVPSHKLVGRGMALVPEGRRIFQHMTVQENLDMGGYSPERRPERGHRERVRALPAAEGTAEAGGRDAVRRRAADAGHGPGADEPIPSC